MTALLLVVLVVALVLGALKWSAWSSAREQSQTREEVTRVAEQFAVRMNNYDHTSVDAYQKSVTPLLTTKFRGKFTKAMKPIVQEIKAAKIDSKGKVLTSAVASVDQDSAEALVVADADVTTKEGNRQRHFRWQVSLDEVDGSWLVDDFKPVA